ncbi:thiol:disulfide interchange protein DsbA/DsbL [Nitrosococcus oceani]|uniref:Thiol:disulfide interchange protein n=2 Tax=Nitrosococcus oceani TaxID=1229 RepID=Q3JDM5_NITOC|nr:thiol:disulfide interchange protein DsbA/DsbL [Nitrosococcus oceani]KFI20479.1 DSBA oxidoreductase [Nitrosococcus oceani C-27]ABA57071.1 DSBA oxidoreductase [Nitrosococcus oceani ATCC 19707]EDZ66663.1 DSBA-like thioredoxin domain protein [Nitrosococcus oceani AFC27]KFI23589.1 DSBA oxidoreductase [Nitrosococcus oceani]GEM19914.1 DSBA oxidoreductase [Nitrosococcus oceani]
MLRFVSGLLLSFSLLLISPLGAAAEPAFTEGVHYKAVSPPLHAMEPGEAEVLEIFWYGCPHCYRFEPILEQWAENKPEDVAFIRVPAIFRDSWQLHAQAFYTAEALGVLDKVHRPLFDAMNLERRQFKTKEALADFFATLGVPKEDFLPTFDSFAVQGKVQQAIATTRASGITGVPAIVINGKYRTDANMAGGFEQMLEVADYLTDQGKTSSEQTATTTE